jgi:hypothetical protein
VETFGEFRPCPFISASPPGSPGYDRDRGDRDDVRRERDEDGEGDNDDDRGQDRENREPIMEDGAQQGAAGDEAKAKAKVEEEKKKRIIRDEIHQFYLIPDR